MASVTRGFLFTDLAASTSLWEQHQSEMGSALSVHDEIVADAIAEAGGDVVKTTGDGFHAVFDTAGAAVSAAIDAQRRLAEHDWGNLGELLVRMGVHFGESEPRDGDFYGPVVNRAARIMAAGHGGQVLLSGAVAAIVAGSLPAGTELDDLGSHRLKDLAEAEHLFQVVDSTLSRSLPPPETLSTRPNNLPTRLSSFLGRDDELEAGMNLLRDRSERLITLIGPGGTGKTRLAVQLGADAIGLFPDGVFFVDLAHVPDAEGMFEALMAALEIAEAPGSSPADSVADHLSHRRMLLILDNLEQVDQPGPPVVALLEGAPDVEVLATTRSALRVRGERLVPVPPLPVPQSPDVETALSFDAVNLFVDRARATDPGFSIDETNVAAIVDICQRLDGLPLAIELAAARVRILGPEGLRDRLADRLDVLRGGASDLPDRQQTLLDAIAWSFDLLDDDEQSMFLALSVFPSASLEAIEAVVAGVDEMGDLDVIDMVESLLDKSLVILSAEGRRFSMLRTIREFASRRLEDQKEFSSATLRSHAEHFAGYAGRPEMTSQVVESELDNFTAAWQYSVDAGLLPLVESLFSCLWPLYERRGWYHRAIRLVEDHLQVMETAGADDPVRELDLRISRARAMLVVDGYSNAVVAAFGDAQSVVQRLGEGEAAFEALRSLSSFFTLSMDFPKAAKLGHQMMAIARESGEPSLLVDAHFVVGSNMAFSGQFAEGMEHIEQSIVLFDPEGFAADRVRVGPTPGVVAPVASAFLWFGAGRIATAFDRMDLALAMARSVDHPVSLAYALYHNAYFALTVGDLQRTGECAAELAEIATENDYLIWRALAMVMGGVARIAAGEANEGLEDIENGMSLYESLPSPPVFWGLLMAVRALAFLLAGRPEGGMVFIDRALELTPENSGGQLEQFSVVKADLLAAQGEVDAARLLLREAVEGAERSGTPTIAVMALRRLVVLGEDRKDALRVALDGLPEPRDMLEISAARALLASD